jgi:hypothetical protein
MLVLAIWATSGVVAALIMALMGAVSPFGWQDKSGFHFGRAPDDVRRGPVPPPR